MTNEDKVNNQSFMRRVIASPWIGLAGLIIAILSIAIAVGVSLALYNAAQTERELVYAVNPILTRVVTAGQSSALEIYHNEQPIGDGNITAIQIAIWNNGKESIRQQNILEAVVIISDPSVPILEVTITKQSRDVIGFTVDNSPQCLANGTVPISWQILEHNDGASVQLIYVGADDINFHLEGIIEGIQEVRLIEPDVRVKTPQEQIESQPTERMFWIAFSSMMLLMFAIFTAVNLVFMRRKPYWGFGKMELFFAVFTITIICVSIWRYIASAPTGPPFGF